MNIKDCIKIFNEYVKKFNLKEKVLMEKFHHTYRVMEFSKEIAESEGLCQADVDLAQLIGLLHDIARFRQYTEYGTFIDHNSKDHGDLGFEVLTDNNYINQFITNKDDQKVVLIAVKNHNKKDIENNITDRELLFSRIIRDADKLDIMVEQCNQISSQNIPFKQELFSVLYDKKLCANKLVENNVDGLFRMISFIFDINFKYSFQFLINKKIIENKLHLLELYSEQNNLNKLDELDKLKSYLLNYIKEKC